MQETPIGLVPYLSILDGRCEEALGFYTQALAADVFMTDRGETMPGGPAPDGKIIHARMRVNGALIFLADDFPEWRGGSKMEPPSGVTLHLQVDDADTWWQRALDAGCTVKFPIADAFWGDRYGQIHDPFGHTWSFGSTLKA